MTFYDATNEIMSTVERRTVNVNTMIIKRAQATACTLLDVAPGTVNWQVCETVAGLIGWNVSDVIENI